MGTSSAQTLLPVFVRSLGASTLVVGLVPALLAFGLSVPQLLTPYFTSHLSYKKRGVVKWHLLACLPWLVAGLYFLLWKNEPPFSSVDLWVFFICFSMVFLSIGYTIPLWLDFLQKSLSPHSSRGISWVFTVMPFASAAGAAFSSFLLSTSYGFPIPYAYCFLTTFIIGMMATMAFLPVDEPPRETASEPRRPFTSYLKTYFATVGKDRNLQAFLLARLCIMGFPALSAFYGIHAKEHFGASDKSIALLVMIFMISQGVIRPFLGPWGERIGHSKIIGCGYLALAAGMVSVYFATSLWYFYLASVMCGFFFSVYIVSQVQWLMAASPTKDTTLYLSIPSVLLVPASTLSPLLIGWLIQNYSYQPVLALCGFFVLLGAMCSFFWVKDKRRSEPGVC